MNIGKKFARLSGRLKPVINLKTKKIYESTLAAEKNDHVPISAIKISCSTGKKLDDNTRYAYVDLDDNPILTEGHMQDHYIGKNAKKVKELVSGTIYKNANEAAKKYNLSSIAPYAEGRLLIAKNQFIFCYLDESNNEIITEQHKIALEKIKDKNKNKYVVWQDHLFYETAKENNKLFLFKNLKELKDNLSIKNASHIKSVCDGKRSNVEGYRIAYFDCETDKPILTKTHMITAKKVVRKIVCLNDQKTYNNCSEAAYEYFVNAHQIGQCAKGILKSVRIKNKTTGKVERYRFAYLDKSNNPILTTKHNEPLTQKKGVSTIILINPTPELIKEGKDRFSSLAEFCRLTGVPLKRAIQYRKDKNVNLLGYEFIELEN